MARGQEACGLVPSSHVVSQGILSVIWCLEPYSVSSVSAASCHSILDPSSFGRYIFPRAPLSERLEQATKLQDLSTIVIIFFVNSSPI